MRVEGRENLPHSPFILCSNHCSHMDAPVLMLATGKKFKQFGMVAAKDYFFDNKKRKNIVTLLMNLIPINRKCTRESLNQDFSLCSSFVQQNNRNLIIYPEGTRSLTGQLQPFKRGPAMIAAELGVSIVPVHIQGTHYALGKGRNFPRRKKISVAFGKPLHPDFYKKVASEKAPFNLYREMTLELESSIKSLKEMHHDE